MDTSIFIARLIGPMLVVLSVGLLARPDTIRAAANEFIASRALIFLSGLLTLLGGLVIVNTHNVWQAGWPVVITIFGWLFVIGGAVRILFPDTVMGIRDRMLKDKTFFTAVGAVEGLIGLWLCYAGYLA